MFIERSAVEDDCDGEAKRILIQMLELVRLNGKYRESKVKQEHTECTNILCD